MNKKSILLTYATRFGSTQETAEFIAVTLRESGLVVDTKAMKDVKQLDNYEAVVLGAALYNTKWNTDAHQFLVQHQKSISQLPVAIFTLGPLSASDAARRNSRRQLDKELTKYPWLKPIAVEIFAGKYDPTRPGMRFFERILPSRDLRNWNAIRVWAKALSEQLERVEMLQFA
jgi:menaquinone-dependent protoporphyrinogen oxidase